MAPFPRALVVVRALPAAAEASYADLGRELDRCLARCLAVPTAHPGRDRRGGAVKTLLVALLRGYRFVISPLYGQVCRYHPTCSAYALEAITVHGSLQGQLARRTAGPSLPPVGSGWL